MHFLFVSNLYPPLARGGYEQWCRELAELFVARGHQVTVLTGRSPRRFREPPTNGVTVLRRLAFQVEGGQLHTVTRLLSGRRRIERQNQQIVEQVLQQTNPDAVLIWGMWNIARAVPARLEALAPGRVGYFLCDYWLALPNAYIQRWQAPARHGYTSLPKRALGRLFLRNLRKEPVRSLQLRRPIGVSRGMLAHLAALGVDLPRASVIYGGTDVRSFLAAAADRSASETLRLLYLGRLEPEKGVDTAVRAMATEQLRDARVTLDIYGAGSPDYAILLRRLVAEHNLTSRVRLRRRVARADVPALMADYDVLIFPSTWEEPFARTVLEGMAAGLIVVGTTTGGTGEILVEDVNGLTFPAGDATALAGQIRRLHDDLELGPRLARAGQQRVVDYFTLDRMAAELEAYLALLGQREHMESTT